MNYKSAYKFIFLLFIPTMLDAISCQLSWNESPSIKIGMNLNDTWAAGIKFNIACNYSNLTQEEEMLSSTNPQLSMQTQTALFIAHTNYISGPTTDSSLKIKAKIIKKNNEPLHISLGSSQHIKPKENNQNYNIKQRLFIHQNNTPEFDIALSCNKKSINKIGLELQGIIKNNEDPYASLNCSIPITSAIGVYGKVLLKKDLSIPQISFYNSNKDNKEEFFYATALNIGLASASFIVLQEIEIRYPDTKKIAAYKQRLIKKYDRLDKLFEETINKVKND